jgi:hypothetical protein
MRKTILPCCLGLLAAACLTAPRLGAAEAKPLRLMAALTGAHCGECVKALRDALGKGEDIRFEAGDVRVEGGSEHHSSRFAIEIADRQAIDIGAVARRVAEAATPHRAQAAPGLFLLFPWKATRNPAERSFEEGRSSLSSLAGVDGRASFPGDRYIWIKLDGTGKARLGEVTKSLADVNLIDDPLGPGDSSGWMLDYEAAKALALQLKKPILLVFR